MSNWVLYGNKSISDLINNSELKHLIKVVYLTKNQKFLLNLCETQNVPYELKNKEWFKKTKIKNKYKYVWAELKSKKYLTLQELINKKNNEIKNLIVILDKIQDSYNFGAILRTCAAANVQGVIVANKKQSPINYAVLKASQGTALNVDISVVENLNQSINILKKSGYWIYSSNLNTKANNYKDVEYEKNSVLILGNEGEGVSYLLNKNADFQVYIPMNEKINSLNVSVAAGILIFKILEK